MRSLGLISVTQGHGFDDKQTRTVEEMLLTALSSTGQFKVIGRSDFDGLLSLQAKKQAAGCNEEESRELTADIRRIRDRGINVLLIEHDMSVVMDVCERIAVLNFGERIAEGTPAEIRDNPVVVEAYLGRDDDAGPRSDDASAAPRGELVG